VLPDQPTALFIFALLPPNTHETVIDSTTLPKYIRYAPEYAELLCINKTRRIPKMNKRTMITTAAAVFAASTFMAASASASVVCAGGNACKGQSACKGGGHACKGQNACKGKGFVNTSSTTECTVLKSK